MFQNPTIMELIQEVIDSGEFHPAPCYEPAEGEEMRLDFFMNDYEKAIFTLTKGFASEFNERLEKLDSGELDSDEKMLENNRLYIIERKIEALDNLFWTSIKERIIEEGVECNIEMIGIGNEYEIVEVLLEEEVNGQDQKNVSDEDAKTSRYPIKINPNFKGTFSGVITINTFPKHPEEN